MQKRRLNQITGQESAQRSTGKASVDQSIMWIEKYAPKTIDELAINKQKVREFTKLVENPGIMILTGPPGSCKNALINAYVSQFGHKLSSYVDTNTLHVEDLYGAKEMVLGGRTYYPKDLENLIGFIRKHSFSSTGGTATHRRPLMMSGFSSAA